MDSWLSKLKNSGMIASVALVLVGLILVIWPNASLDIFVKGIGAGIIFTGIGSLVLKVKNGNNSSVLFVLDLLIMLIGAFIVTNPAGLSDMIILIAAFYILANAVDSLVRAANLKKSGYGLWWLAMLFGLISFGFGIYMIFNMHATKAAVIRIIGLVLVYSGATKLWVLTRAANKIKQEQMAKEQEIVNQKTAQEVARDVSAGKVIDVDPDELKKPED